MRVFCIDILDHKMYRVPSFVIAPIFKKVVHKPLVCSRVANLRTEARKRPQFVLSPCRLVLNEAITSDLAVCVIRVTRSQSAGEYLSGGQRYGKMIRMRCLDIGSENLRWLQFTIERAHLFLQVFAVPLRDGQGTKYVGRVTRFI